MPAAKLDATLLMQWAQAPLLAGVAASFSPAGSLSAAAASAGEVDTGKQSTQPTSAAPHGHWHGGQPRRGISQW